MFILLAHPRGHPQCHPRSPDRYPNLDGDPRTMPICPRNQKRVPPLLTFISHIPGILTPSSQPNNHTIALS